jgi:hypothetical protein
MAAVSLRAWSPTLRIALYAALVVAAIFLLVTLSKSDLGGASPTPGLAGYEEALRTRQTVTAVAGTAVAFGLMGAAWLRRFAGPWDAAGVLGAWMCALTGYVEQPPSTWLLLPAFLAPWALLFVELAPRHRIVLLLMQWLTSIKFLETLTASTASTLAVAALGVLHLVLVWVGLRGSPLGRVPLLVGAILGGVGAAVTLVFLAVEPTPRRLLALVPSVALLLAVGLLAKGKLLAGARLPTVLMPDRRQRVE